MAPNMATKITQTIFILPLLLTICTHWMFFLHVYSDVFCTKKYNRNIKHKVFTTQVIRIQDGVLYGFSSFFVCYRCTLKIWYKYLYVIFLFLIGCCYSIYLYNLVLHIAIMVSVRYGYIPSIIYFFTLYCFS